MFRAVALVAWLAIAIGCGRIGFDASERGTPSDGPGDGTTTTDGTDASGVVAVDYLKPQIVGAGDRFGAKLAISDDGSTLAVGAYAEASNATGINGDAKATNTETGDAFGSCVAISGAGGALVIGALGEDSEGGAVYVVE